MPEADHHREVHLEPRLDQLVEAQEALHTVDIVGTAVDMAADIDHHTAATDLMFQSTITLDLMVMLLS